MKQVRSRHKRHDAVSSSASSPIYYVCPEGRRHVETENGADRVWLSNAKLTSFNGELTTADANDEEIAEYYDLFPRHLTAFNANARRRPSSSASPSTEDDSGDDNDNDNESDNELPMMFASQAYAWRAILQQREQTARQQAETDFTMTLIADPHWGTQLLHSAAIRNIIRSLEGTSTTTLSHAPRPAIPPSSSLIADSAEECLFFIRDTRLMPGVHVTCDNPTCPLPDHSISTAGGSYISLEPFGGDWALLHRTPGIQINDSQLIPIFVRLNKDPPTEDEDESLSEQQANDQASDADPYQELSESESVATQNGSEKSAEEFEGDEMTAGELYEARASFCIGCIRRLYSADVAPAVSSGRSSSALHHLSDVVLSTSGLLYTSSMQAGGSESEGGGGGAVSSGWATINVPSTPVKRYEASCSTDVLPADTQLDGKE